MAPACTSVIVRLGLADALVAVDSWSARLDGVSPNVPSFDMMKPDAERIAELNPSIIFVSSMTRDGANSDPFKPISDAGATVAYIPTSQSVQDIRDDIERIASLVGKEKEGKVIVREMDEQMERVTSVARAIPEGERKTVYFEISPAPYLYSFGSGVYLDELIADAGARNIFSREKGWIAVNAESVALANPDVIITNDESSADPVAEILSRPGWAGVAAVANRRVFRIDANASSRPGPDVARALEEIARAVYPERF